MQVNKFIIERAIQKVASRGIEKQANPEKGWYDKTTDWLANLMVGNDERRRRDILQPDQPVTLGSKVPVMTDGRVTGSKPAFTIPNLRAAQIYNNQRRIDNAEQLLEDNNGLLHPKKERRYAKELKEAKEDAWHSNDNLKGLDNIDITNMPYIEAAKQYPSIIGTKGLDPNALIANTVARYYPNINVKDSTIKGLHKATATYPEWYKASYANPEIAEQAFARSQEARKNANVTPNHGYYPMGSWLPEIDWNKEYPSMTEYLNKGDSHDVLFYNMAPFNDNAGFLDNLKAGFRAYQILNKDDRSSRAIADLAGPHINLLGGGAVPMDKGYKPDADISKAVGNAANLRDIFAHELQHITTGTTPSERIQNLIRSNISTDTGALWSNNGRNFYSMVPAETDRALHGIKAIASDLNGSLVTNYDDAINILQKNNIITKNQEGFDFNYDTYEQLLGSGKIKPTDPSMVIDLLNLDQYQGGKSSQFSDYSNTLYDNAVDPRTGDKVSDDHKRSDMPEVWKEMLQHRFEMANNTNKNYRPGLGYTNGSYTG